MTVAEFFQLIMKKVMVFILIALLVYCAAYGVVRWRKLIVMGEYDLKEQSLLVRETRPGWDVRDDWKGHLKNRINGSIFILFRPLELLENKVRGFRKALPVIPETPNATVIDRRYNK